jgi:hypothetical protein
VKKALTLLVLLSLCAAADAAPSHGSKSANISGSGCVEKAVENSCRVIIDSQTGELYNLLFPAKIPKTGTAIKFSGTTQKGVTVCMQGKPVKVSKWTKEKGIKCPPSAVMAQAGR